MKLDEVKDMLPQKPEKIIPKSPLISELLDILFVMSTLQKYHLLLLYPS